MDLSTPSSWPIYFICAAMLACAVVDWWKFKVPNKLTFPIVISGWLFGLLHTFGGYLVAGDGAGGIGSALLGTLVGFALLYPVYALGGMGAGDVKMCMGFGAWIGAFFGVSGGALWIIVFAFITGVLVGGVIALGMILVHRQFGRNWQHTREILADLAQLPSKGISAVAASANERRPRWLRLPYGVPLCIGFLMYLFFPMLPQMIGIPSLQREQEASNKNSLRFEPSVVLVATNDGQFASRW